MTDIILYSTGCPRCTVLKAKLDSKKISYEEIHSIDTMIGLGISQVPVLSVNGQLKDFKEAVDWVNSQEEND